jgi:CheY-like chemotaxis protein
MKILIVDDDVSRSASLVNYLITEKVIEPAGVYTSTNMDDAVQKLRSFHFDVVILDVVIPKRGNEKADSKWTFSLLYKINRSKEIKKPGKIIGITGYLSDLGDFRKKFEDYCLVVIEANRTSAGWKRRIAEYIGYDYLAQAHREIANESLNIITIHGIRTFGHWQNRLRELTHANLAALPFHSYRYGYTSFLSLFSESAHEKHVEILKKRLLEIASANPDANFMFFAHSFGTFLLVEALKKIAEGNEIIRIKTVVLAGSVLKSNYDISFLLSQSICVVNDCGHSDYVLWLSEAFVPGLGMAGKLGFYGFENLKLVNRFFLGGHSSYFDNDSFMENHWLPIIGGGPDIQCIDYRTSSALKNDIAEEVVISIGEAKEKIVDKFRRLKRRIGLR